MHTLALIYTHTHAHTHTSINTHTHTHTHTHTDCHSTTKIPIEIRDITKYMKPVVLPCPKTHTHTSK